MKNFLNNSTFIGIAALVQIALGIIVLVFEFIPATETKGMILFWSIYGLFMVFLIYLLFIALIHRLKRPKNKFTRFEDIEKSNIKYGYVVYKPFFWNEGTAPITHKGIGYKVLEEVLKPLKVDMNKCENFYSSNWSRIFKELENGKFDIIIIPLFETRTRLNKYNVCFCSPLFYSDIGLYAKKEHIPDKKFLFGEAIKFVKRRNWKGKHLKHEISNNLMTKHKLDSTEIKPTVSKFNEDTFFQRIIDEINNDETDFTFMEVFKAKTIIKDRKTPAVINILEDKELLYPVSFVVRKEDTVLKNFINLRLMEMDLEQVKDSYDNGKEISKLKQLVKEAAVEGGISADEFNGIFVRRKYVQE